VSAGRITIVGAGAIGGYVGSMLAADGTYVVLVDSNQDHIAAIREHGLRVKGNVDLHVRPKAVVPSELEGPVETVLLAVKAGHTEEALAPIEPLLTDDGCVVSLQNGLEELRIARRVGSERTVGAFLTFGGHYVRPGEIIFGGRGSFVIGEVDGKQTPRLEELAKLLGRAHPVSTTNRIFSFLWGKTALEAFYFASALTDRDVIDLLDDEDALPALGALVAEVALVADAVGSRCASVDGFDPNSFADGDPDAVAASWDAQRLYWNAHVARRTGIWRDLAVHHRPTEVGAILDPVVNEGARAGIDTPLVRRLIELVREAETGVRALGADVLPALAVAT